MPRSEADTLTRRIRKAERHIAANKRVEEEAKRIKRLTNRLIELLYEGRA